MERTINPSKVFFNFGGDLPKAPLAEKPAAVPPATQATHPKRITDTTLRDGAQDSRFALFPNEARVKYFDLLHELDNSSGFIEQVEVFIYQQRDLWCLDRLLEREYAFPQVTTWTRASPKDIKLMVEVTKGRVKETGMLASASDHHIFDKLRFRSKQEAVEKYLEPIITACEHNIIPRVHLEDATKADVYGFLVPFMQRVMKETKGKAKFRVCDTLGLGVPFPEAALPFGVPKLVSTLQTETDAELEFHGHNDFGFATANNMAAWMYGAKRVNVTSAGLGERTGNTSLEQVLTNYIRIYGNPGVKLDVLGKVRDLIDSEVYPVPSKQPILGDVWTTQAGIHQSGVNRQDKAEGGLIYLPFAPETVGRKPETLSLVGALSGMDGILRLMNDRYRERTGASEDKYASTSKAAKYVYDKVQEAYDGVWDSTAKRWRARTTFFTADELLALAREYEENEAKAS